MLKIVEGHRIFCSIFLYCPIARSYWFLTFQLTLFIILLTRTSPIFHPQRWGDKYNSIKFISIKYIIIEYIAFQFRLLVLVIGWLSRSQTGKLTPYLTSGYTLNLTFTKKIKNIRFITLCEATMHNLMPAVKKGSCYRKIPTKILRLCMGGGLFLSNKTLCHIGAISSDN